MSPRPFDPMRRARTFTREPSPRRELLSFDRRITAAQATADSALDLASQPDADTPIETLYELPECTTNDVGRKIVVQTADSSEIKEYTGVLNAFGVPIWMQISGTTDIVAYSWVRAIGSSGNALMADTTPAGNVIVTRFDNDVVSFYDPEAGTGISSWTTTVNSCAAVAAGNQMQTPAGIVYHDANNVFVAYRTCHKIVIWDDATDKIRASDPVIGSGVAGSGTNDFNSPWGIDADADSLYVADSGNNRIIKRSLTAPYPWEQTIGSLGTGNGQLSGPTDVAIDQSGNIYVADRGNNRIQKFSASGSFVWKVGGTATGTGDGQFNAPQSLAIDPRGRLHVVDSGNHRVQVFDQNGVFLTKYGSGPGSGNEQFNTPTGIAFVATGLAIVTDPVNIRLSVWQEGPSVPSQTVPKVINDLSDVSITSPASGAFLRYSNGNWIDSGITISREVRTDNVIGGGQVWYVDVDCPNGYVVTGGGFANTANNRGRIYQSYPKGNLSAWHCEWYNEASTAVSAECYAVCMKTP